jgi:hypothetical protein
LAPQKFTHLSKAVRLEDLGWARRDPEAPPQLRYKLHDFDRIASQLEEPVRILGLTAPK